MSVGILKDRDSGQQVLYCNTSDWAFGPVFSDDESVEGFLVWLRVDPRSFNDAELTRKVSDWRAAPTIWDCQDCDTAFKAPPKTCPECGGDDIREVVKATNLCGYHLMGRKGDAPSFDPNCPTCVEDSERKVAEEEYMDRRAARREGRIL